MDAQAGVAIYAAIVATGALALEVRRWFESGPRIKVRIQPNMVMVGGRQTNENFLVATVRNRGNVATTITTMGMIYYPNAFWRIIRQKGNHFVVPHPGVDGMPSSVPHVLEPGTQWTGLVNKTANESQSGIADWEDGNLLVEVYTSDRDRPYRVRVPKRKSKLATEIKNEQAT